ncbi:MAG: M3 family metallopeptidase [Vulcanimicrobiota bacterium]
MKRRTFLAASGAALLLRAVGLPANAQAMKENPLLQTWTGPNGGVPPFNKIRPDMFGPAFEASMASYRKELAAIADNSEPATFENTLAALEGSGRDYSRVSLLFGIWTSTLNTPEVQRINTEWSPKFAAFSDEIVQNQGLFTRIEQVYNSPEKAKLSAEQQRLAWLYYTNFVREGAKLGAEAKAELSTYNQRLAELYTKFSQNQLADEENHLLVLEGKADLAGLPESFIDAAAAAAEEKGQKGKWAIRNTRSSMEPFLTYSERRDLREKGWRMWVGRGDNGDEHDNNAICSEILMLRAKRAKLLGYPTHAHWRLENAMAKNPDNAMDLMLKVWKPAVARVHQEVADMQAVADQNGDNITIEPWDYRYYSEKVRKAKYDLDQAAIKPYLQLANLRDGQFWQAGQLYGFTFHPVEGLPVYHPEVEIFEVKGRDGGHVGYWYWDPYARDGKDSGAWMNEYRTQEKFKKTITPIVSNNSNYVKGKPGEPVLISWDDAETMFHEFGHALHGLNSNVNYPSLAGTNVARDYVEFPSQVNEHWLSTPEVLNQFALHYQTGKAMPAELVEKIEKAATFNQGFATVEYLASAIVDMKLHLAGEVEIDTRKFEKETLDALGMPKEIVMRHRIPQFGHVFSGDGYSAGYYSYLWSEVLDHDCWEAFLEADGPYDKKVAKRLHDDIMQVGNTIDPAVAYRNFRGRDPKIEALLRSRGFPTS